MSAGDVSEGGVSADAVRNKLRNNVQDIYDTSHGRTLSSAPSYRRRPLHSTSTPTPRGPRERARTRPASTPRPRIRRAAAGRSTRSTRSLVDGK